MVNLTSLIIAEDDADDRLLIEDAMNENDIPSDCIQFVDDGDKLIEKLAEFKDKPVIVFLDLNMPRKDGRQALKEIKAEDQFKHIPIIIFSTSSNEEDIKTSYKHGVNTYFTKPSKYSELVEIIATVKSYWWDKASYIC